MKKIKLLPSIIMLALCLAVLGIGVYSATTGSNAITGTLTVNSAGYEVDIAVYKSDTSGDQINSTSMYGTQIGEAVSSRAGKTISLSDIAFNSDSANTIADVEMIDLIVAVTNKSSDDIGIYFWNKGEATSVPEQAQIVSYIDGDGDGNVLTVVSYTDVLYGHHGLSGTRNSEVYNDVIDAEYSFYHHVPGYTVSMGDTTYYTEYLHIYLRLNESGFLSEETEVNLEINLNVEKYLPNLVSTDIDGTTGAYSYNKSRFVKIARGLNSVSFSYIEPGDGMFSNQYVTHVVFPYGMTIIPTLDISEGFSYGSSLQSVGLVALTLPITITSLPESFIGMGDAFYYDKVTMDSIIIPSEVTSIGNSAFSYRSGIKYIHIPEAVSSLGSPGYLQFAHCDNLAIIEFNGALSSAARLDSIDGYHWELNGVTVTEIAAGTAGQGIYLRVAD